MIHACHLIFWLKSTQNLLFLLNIEKVSTYIFSCDTGSNAGNETGSNIQDLIGKELKGELVTFNRVVDGEFHIINTVYYRLNSTVRI